MHMTEHFVLSVEPVDVKCILHISKFSALNIAFLAF